MCVCLHEEWSTFSPLPSRACLFNNTSATMQVPCLLSIPILPLRYFAEHACTCYCTVAKVAMISHPPTFESEPHPSARLFQSPGFIVANLLSPSFSCCCCYCCCHCRGCRLLSSPASSSSPGKKHLESRGHGPCLSTMLVWQLTDPTRLHGLISGLCVHPVAASEHQSTMHLWLPCAA